MSSALCKSKLFMQNKPNLQNPKTNLTPYPKKNYAKISSLRPQKNKPNSNPIKPSPKLPTPPNYPHPTSNPTQPNPNPMPSSFVPRLASSAHPSPKLPTCPNYPQPKSKPLRRPGRDVCDVEPVPLFVLAQTRGIFYHICRTTEKFISNAVYRISYDGGNNGSQRFFKTGPDAWNGRFSGAAKGRRGKG